jgi:nucleoid DNA-binding protein
MIKAEIVKRAADRLKMRDKEALVVIDGIIESIKKVVAEQGRLEIRDFGVFQTKTRKERIGRNPKDKKEYPIPSRRVVTFKMGRELKLSGEGQPGGRSEAAGHSKQASEDSPGPEATV